MDSSIEEHRDLIGKHALDLSYILQLKDISPSERHQKALEIWNAVANSTHDPIEMGRCKASLDTAQQHLSDHEAAGTDPVKGFKADFARTFLARHTAILSNESGEARTARHKELAEMVAEDTPLAKIYHDTLTQALQKVEGRETRKAGEGETKPIPKSTTLPKPEMTPYSMPPTEQLRKKHGELFGKRKKPKK